MSLHKYANQAFQLADAFRASLSKEDTVALAKDLLTLGEEGWHLGVWKPQSNTVASGSNTLTNGQATRLE
jgi:hypothetical protein